MTVRAGLRAWRPAQMSSASISERTLVKPSNGFHPGPLSQGVTGAGHAGYGVTTPRPGTPPGWLALWPAAGIRLLATIAGLRRIRAPTIPGTW
jgi:hypothetical protein